MEGLKLVRQGMTEVNTGMHALVVHLEQQVQKLMAESQQLQEEARCLLTQRLTQVHVLQDEVSKLRHSLEETEQLAPLRQELERLHREVESWRSQHASLHQAWQDDRRLIEEWERRWQERQRVGQLAQQLRKTMEGSACS
jgi:hypothetical protein